jgi:type II secretory pathway pseudopilin PulG
LSDVVFSQGGRRSKKGAAAGGAGRTVGIVVLVVLLVAIVVLAIALPIVFTRRTQQDAANAAAAGRAATSGTSGTSGAAGTPAGTPVLGSNPVDPGDVASQGSLGQGLLAPVGPNLNTGNDVFCYKSASTGEILPGAFRKTGVKSRDENDIERVEVKAFLPMFFLLLLTCLLCQVRSCGSGSIMSLLESQLVVCSVPCFTPVWLAVKNGILVRPIWEEPIVCRGDQVYENRGLTGGSGSRYTFYWRFAGFVEEQLISQCDGDSAWWVPNVELSYCNVDQKVKCETANLNRAKPKGTPLLVQGMFPKMFFFFLFSNSFACRSSCRNESTSSCRLREGS